VRLLQQAQPLDTQRVVPRLLQALVRPFGDETPLDALSDIFARVNRADPGTPGALEARDWQTTLPVLRDFLLDPERGVARLLAVTEGRNAPP
jgi:hypothetical protein